MTEQKQRQMKNESQQLSLLLPHHCCCGPAMNDCVTMMMTMLICEQREFSFQEDALLDDDQ